MSPAIITPSFPCCPTARATTVVAARRRALGEATSTSRRQLLNWPLALFPPDERPLCVLDSLPVPVVGFHHAQGRHRWYGWASYGYNATQKQTIYGDRE